MQVVTEYPLYNLPPSIETLIEERLKSYGFSISQPKAIAEAVRTLSNLFIRGGAQLGYWHVPAMRAAYTAYFFPLNFLRARAVFLDAARLGYLEDIKVLEDWGCGAGSATWAALFTMPLNLKLKVMGFDQSEEVLSEFAFWSEKLLALHGSWPGRFQIKNQEKDIRSLAQSKADTIILSYALAEVEEWPEVPKTLQNLILIEPSTNQQGRKLLQYREKLLADGWSAWAPCTHQYDCPLLVNSGKDWCHHRIHWNKPAWYEAIETHLPMKNDTLTMSYLLLSRRPAPYFLNGLTRVVGDTQEELGKSRQMVCRGPQREFMSWLHRDQYNIQLHRGDLIRLGEVIPKANELRVHAESILEPVQLTGDRYYDRVPRPKV